LIIITSERKIASEKREEQSAATDSPLWISQESADGSRTSSRNGSLETAAWTATTVVDTCTYEGEI
jgi:hypothetical protein